MSDASLSSGGRCGAVSSSFVFPHSADDAVGEVAFVGSSGLSPGLAFPGLAIEECSGVVAVALLGDRGDVEHTVDPSVAAEVEPVVDGFSVAFS